MQGEIRFACQQSGHCCIDSKIIVTLTFKDLCELFTAVGSDFRILLQKISFYTLDSSTTPLIQKQMVLEPIETSQGRVLPGLRKLGGKFCVFYSHPNCAIYPNRPLACRNYPFTFLEENKQVFCTWVKNSRKTCPGIGKGFKQSLTDLENLGKQFFKEIQLHNNVVQELNVEALNGRPLTAREALWVLVTYGESKQK